MNFIHSLAVGSAAQQITSTKTAEGKAGNRRVE